MTNLIHIDSVNNVDVVDSRLIAEELGIQHATLLKTIKKHLSRLERKSPVRFEICLVKRPQGGTYEITYCYLNEYQATLLMTFSRNTEQVLNCKEKLVDSFDKAKKVIVQQVDRIRELELQAEILRNQKYLLDKRESIASFHGLSTLAQLEGREYIEVEKPTIEIVDNISGQTNKVMSADELKKYVYKMTGQRIKSKKQLVDHLHSIGRDDLLVTVRRQNTTQDIDADKIEEAIALFNNGNRQMLLGE